MRYAVIDVETPNRSNDKISAIAYVIIEGKEIIKDEHYLCNPETAFDSINERLTGITAEDIKDSLTFPAIWDEILSIIEGAVWVGHGFHFDLNVLCKCLTSYGLPIPAITYCDTIALTKQAYPDLDSYRLDTLCREFNIPLDHHKAESDALATATLLLRLMDTGVDIENFSHAFEWSPLDSSLGYAARPRKLSETTMRINYLLNMLEDISEDGIISADEIQELQEWMDDNDDLKGNIEFDKLWSALSSILVDGIVSDDERQALLNLAVQLQDPVKAAQAVIEISLDGKTVCLSGDFDNGSKAEISAMLQARGAILQDRVTQKLDFLIVGGQGSSAWSAGNYGSKVKKALALQEKGLNIQIIREMDLFNCLGTFV